MLVESIPADVPFPGQAGRSPGVHVSRIIRNIAVEAGFLKPEWVDDLSLIEAGQEDWWKSLTPADRLRMSIGLAWERYYLGLLDGVIWQPGEMCVEGIYMTHDGESLDMIVTENHPQPQAVLCLHECKATYKSTRTVGDLQGQLMWLMQTRAYCMGLKTRRAKIHVLFMCGDYSYPITPQLKCWLVTYTQAEIDDNWEMLRDYVREHKELM